jgi:hypothetical protein
MRWGLSINASVQDADATDAATLALASAQMISDLDDADGDIPAPLRLRRLRGRRSGRSRGLVGWQRFVHALVRCCRRKREKKSDGKDEALHDSSVLGAPQDFANGVIRIRDQQGSRPSRLVTLASFTITPDTDRPLHAADLRSRATADEMAGEVFLDPAFRDTR